jgi:succinyl-diaminopimelate desuccinylase
MSSSDPIAIARDLIRCPSVTPAEGGALRLLARVLEKVGFKVQHLSFSEPGTASVENLYARIGEGSPHLVFAGHTDVVPPGEASRWTHPPFSAVIEHEELYGRGAADMKGAIACFVAAASAHVAAHGGTPNGSLSLLITGDEEGPAINGMAKLLKWAAEHGIRFDQCLLGEPTNAERLGDAMKIGRRGSLNGTLIVTGKQGHVAYPQLADSPIPVLLALMNRLMTEPLDHGTEHFDPSHLEFTSVDVGNPTVNMIPGEARARFNIRYNDRHSQDSLKRLIKIRCRDAGADRGRISVEFAPSNSDVFLTAAGPFLDLVVDAVFEVTGLKPQLSTSGGTSDARFIKNYCPVVEFGLIGRTIHQTDERVALSDLRALTAIYRRIVDRYFASDDAAVSPPLASATRPASGEGPD